MKLTLLHRLLQLTNNDDDIAASRKAGRSLAFDQLHMIPPSTGLPSEQASKPASRLEKSAKRNFTVLTTSVRDGEVPKMNEEAVFESE